MATGFVYVVSSVGRDYMQPAFSRVPTELGNRLYFGFCKRLMRPLMRAGDFIAGISPSCTSSRRILFVAGIEEAMTFAAAYRRFPGLRGPEGPIRVRSISGTGPFPGS